MGLDSVELIIEFEKYFSIVIPDRDAEKASTVGKLVDCVAKILEIENYDFKLRDDTFSGLKKAINKLTESENLFSITDKVNDNLKFEDRGHLAKLEQLINLKLPGIHITDEKTSGLFARFKNWINFSPVYNFNEITCRRNINAVLAHNMETAINPKLIKSKYEIYVVIMRMVVDKIGVDYLEIGIEKSFTDDLGVD